jgi:DivIVA domain-containing protein
MIDLTPLDVRKKRGDFRRILRGYDPEEVDTFMDLVAERFEELVRENLTLSEKTGRLESQLEALVGRESAVQEALVLAQKLREEVQEQSRRDAEVLEKRASRQAELLKAETDAEIKRRLGEAEGLMRERQRALEDLERSRLKFLKSFRGLLERELDSVEVEEARRPLEEIPLELEFRGWMPEVKPTDVEDLADAEDVDWDLDESEPGEDPEVTGAEGASAEVEDETDIEPDQVDAVADSGSDAESEGGAELETESELEAGSEVGPGEAPELERAVATEDDLSETEEALFLDDAGPRVDAGVEEDPWAMVVEPEKVRAGADAPEADDLEEIGVVEAAPSGEAGGGELPGGFDTQVLEGAAPAGLSHPEPQIVDGESETPEIEGPDQSESLEEEASPPEEPRWLFSLLKKEGQGEDRA